VTAAVLASAALAFAGPGAAGQEPNGGQEPPAAQQALLEPLDISPGGAFLRAALVPGWGHVAIGSYTRGGFYFALEAATAYTLIRTRRRLSEARERADLREGVVRANLADEGITDPQEIRTRLEQDAILGGFEDLVASREGQQEDLVAFGIFVIFLTGADAYVSAHLARFPAPIELQATPTGSGRAEVSLRIPLPDFP
jgi:hypothetical protein